MEDGNNMISIPFELHAYDAILTTVKVLQSQQLDRVNNMAVELLSYTKKGSLLPLELQEEMRELKNIVSHMGGKLDAYRRALNELLDNDCDMALMNLSLLAEKPILYKYVLPLVINASYFLTYSVIMCMHRIRL